MKFATERILIFFLLIIITALSLRSCLRKEKENIALQNAVLIKEDSTSFWKDSLGRVHAQKRQLEGNINSLRTLYKAQLDSIARTLKIKENDIQGVTMLKTTGSGSLTPKIDTLTVDSSFQYKFSYSDKWLTLDGIISSKPLLRYSYSDSLIITTYSKRLGLFRRQTYLDAYSLNPNLHIANVTGIKVTPLPSGRFGFGPYFGYGFNGHELGFTFGLSVHYSLIRF